MYEYELYTRSDDSDEDLEAEIALLAAGAVVSLAQRAGNSSPSAAANDDTEAEPAEGPAFSHSRCIENRNVMRKVARKSRVG